MDMNDYLHPQEAHERAFDRETCESLAYTISQDVTAIVTSRPKERSNKTARKHHANRSRYCKERLQRHKGQFDELFNYNMESLISACKIGNLPKALNAARRLANFSFLLLFTDPELIMIRLLFMPEKGGRSGLHHAAQAGHKEMVKVFLAHLVIERASRRQWAERIVNKWEQETWERNLPGIRYNWYGALSKKYPYGYVKPARWIQTEGSFDPTKKPTMLGWLDFVGFPSHFFSPKDFERCKIDASSAETRDVFDKTTFSFIEILNTVNSVTENENPRPAIRPSLNTLQDRRRKHFLPTLYYDDDLNPDLDGINGDGPEHDFDYWSELDDQSLSLLDCTMPGGYEVTDAGKQTRSAKSGPSHAAEEHPGDHMLKECALEASEAQWVWIEFGQLDSYPRIHELRVCHVETPDEVESQWTCVDTVGDASATQPHLSHLSVTLDDASGFQMVSCSEYRAGNPNTEESTRDKIAPGSDEDERLVEGAEPLQDLFSIINRLDSHPIRKSYSEVLLCGPSKKPNESHRNLNLRHSLRKINKAERILKEEDEVSDSMFDCWFDIEGVKGARGGKGARMFKGEGRAHSATMRSGGDKRRKAWSK